MKENSQPTPGKMTPGDSIRAVRQRLGLKLSEVSTRTGLAVSTLSKLEKGHVSLSYDKLMLLSKALGVDMAELLAATTHPPASSAPLTGGGRRVVHRAGEGQLVETGSYSQRYLATELLQKRFTPMVVELRARTMDDFLAEFGDFIRHPGEEFAMVLQGVVEFRSELYAPARLEVGDSVFFDSEMGHAYLKASDEVCKIVATCAPRGKDESMIETFVHASEKHAASRDATTSASARPARAPTARRTGSTRSIEGK